MTDYGAKPGLWREQFDPVLDLPTTAVLKKYAVCTTPRSGSHFLGHLLHQAGGFGYPLEYVQSANFDVWRARAREAGASDTLSYIKSIRTDDNGVFGIKLHYRHLTRFLENEPEVLSYRFITLERRELIKQAVSYAWAAQTKSWISGMPELAPARYDWELIAQKLAVITESNAGWRAFLAKIGCPVHHLFFEDVRIDPESATRGIANFLEVELTTPRRETFFPMEQAQPGKEEWVHRFIIESRERLSRGTLVPQKRSPRSGLLKRITSLLSPHEQQ